MANNLKEFVPQSPDPFIIDGPDQGLVKFGHLNYLIRLIKDLPVYADNVTAIAGGLEPGDLYKLTNTAAPGGSVFIATVV